MGCVTCECNSKQDACLKYWRNSGESCYWEGRCRHFKWKSS